MSENKFEYRVSLDTRQMVDDIAKRIQDEVDQAALDKAAATLAKFGYVKVVRCRDCKHFKDRNGAILPSMVCERWRYYNFKTEPERYCAWGERREQ